MPQFLTFCCVGMANTLLGLAVIYALKLFIGASDLSANVAGYALGMAVSFLVNKVVTFGHARDYLGAVLRFVLVQIVAYALNLVTVLLLIRGGANSYAAQALGIIPYSVSGFLGAKFFVFAIARQEPVANSGLKP
jgi:putative flippase GtrA